MKFLKSLWGGAQPSSGEETSLPQIPPRIRLQHLHLRNSTTWRLVMGLLLLDMSYLPLTVYVYLDSRTQRAPKKLPRKTDVRPRVQEAQLSLTNRALLFWKLLRYCRTFCQTRKVWLPDGEKNPKICLFVLTWSTNVTDRRTDKQTEEQTDTGWQHRPRLHSVAR